MQVTKYADHSQTLIRTGKAYVDDLSADEIREYRGTFSRRNAGLTPTCGRLNGVSLVWGLALAEGLADTAVIYLDSLVRLPRWCGRPDFRR